MMRRIAVPMVGGMVSSTVLTLLVIPAIYALVKRWQLSRISGLEICCEARGTGPC
jgi:Cu(I)/Ag(I) efflux system membrane protein CusA/SilA